MSRKRAAVARTARGARSGDGHTTPNAAAAAGVLGRSAARAGLAVPLYLEALEAGAMARLADGRDGQWPQHDLHRLLVAAERLGLDPLGGEIYAVPGGPDAAGPALLVLGVDGCAGCSTPTRPTTASSSGRGLSCQGSHPEPRRGLPGDVCRPGWSAPCTGVTAGSPPV